MKLLSAVLASLVLLVNSAPVVYARDVTLYWEPSPSPAVVGYKVYYQQGSPQLPLSGTGADQGPSPIDVENSLTAHISGLTDGPIYYFSVTAYDSNNNESGFSNIVSTAWGPPLTAPINNAVAVSLPVTFRWEAAPWENNLHYTLHYGSSLNDVTFAGFVSPGATDNGSTNAALPVLTAVLLLLCATALVSGAGKSAGKFPTCTPLTIRVVVPVLALLVISACGGGGGGGGGESGTTDSTTTPTIPGSPAPAPSESPDVTLMSVIKGADTYHRAFDLESGSTYYWKVTAADPENPSLIYTSQVYSFTTQ